MFSTIYLPILRHSKIFSFWGLLFMFLGLILAIFEPAKVTGYKISPLSFSASVRHELKNKSRKLLQGFSKIWNEVGGQ